MVTFTSLRYPFFQVVLLTYMCGTITATTTYIVTAGGFPFTSVSEALDTKNDTWVPLPALPTATIGQAMAQLNGTIYAIAGRETVSQVVTFTPGNSSWQKMNDLPHAKDYGATAVTIGDAIYVVGGWQDLQGLLIFRKGGWTAGPSSTYQHFYSGGAAFNNSFYVCGEYNPSTNCERFDTIQKKWIPVASMHQPRELFAMTEMGGFIYAIGGSPGVNERMDPHQHPEVWTSVPPLKTARYYHAVGNDGRRLFAIGGSSADESIQYDSVEVLEPEPAWQDAPFKLSSARFEISAVLFDSKELDQSENTLNKNSTTK